MKNAIEKAIEGGWKESLEIDRVEIIRIAANGNDDFNFSLHSVKLHHADKVWEYDIEIFFLDPLFWQALGKAMKWPEYKKVEGFGNMQGWEFYWHRFVSSLAAGKDAQSFFFTELLKNDRTA